MHELLVEELTAVQYEAPSGGKIKVEDKKAIKERTGLTLDIADAFILTHAEIIAIMNEGGGTGWPDEIPLIDYGSV